MEGLTLEANKRDTVGKKTRFLRRQGITPTHLFGHGLESLTLECDTAELQKIIAHAGRTRVVTLKVPGEKQRRSVFIKEVQRNPITGELLHVDLYQVLKTEKMRVEVPLVLVGESPALKGKGATLMHTLTELSIECLPGLIPPQIEVDLGQIQEIGQAIYVRDIILDADIAIHSDPEQLVARVAEVYVERAEEATAEAEEATKEPAEATAEATAEEPAEA